MKEYEVAGKVYAVPDDATMEQVAAYVRSQGGGPKAPISKEERAAYEGALPGTPEGMKVREGIEAKHGGREAFLNEYDPLGEFLGKEVLPPALAAAIPYGVGQLAVASRAPLIARTAQKRYLAEGGQPATVETGAKEVADLAMKGAGKVKDAAKATWEDPRVQMLVKAILGGAGFEGARRYFEGGRR